MKVYQCFHKYDKYIPYFEEKYKPVENNLSFNEWRNLFIKDGFLSCYILQPAIEEKVEEVFCTIWNYEALQLKWAAENGIKTKNLEEIKLAQLEEFKPDVFYNFSPYYDNNFIDKIFYKKDMVKVCWDSIITKRPSYHEKFDLRFSLFEPYVKYWNQNGFSSFILPPAFPKSWDELNPKEKDIDILFYGQYGEYFFSERNKILKELVSWTKHKGYNFKLHLYGAHQKRPIINKKGFRKITSVIPVAPQIITKNALDPIFGMQLYETIARSKIVVNSFTNFNGLFKDNMRNYETIGCGAFLISEDGIYPEHFRPNIDFYTYRSSAELFEKIQNILSFPDQGLLWSEKTREKLKLIYSKEKQWKNFTTAINSL
jgi:hypothetical protein